MYIEKDMFRIPTGMLEQLSDISKLLIPRPSDVTVPPIVNCHDGCSSSCSGSCGGTCAGSCYGTN